MFLLGDVIVIHRESWQCSLGFFSWNQRYFWQKKEQIFTFSAFLDFDSIFDFGQSKMQADLNLFINSNNSKCCTLSFLIAIIVSVISFPIATSISHRLAQVLRDIFVICKMLGKLVIIGTSQTSGVILVKLGQTASFKHNWLQWQKLEHL